MRVWDVASGGPRAALQAHDGGTWCVAFSPDSKILASGGRDSTAKLWDVQTWQLKQTLDLMPITKRKSSVQSIVFSRDGTMVILGSSGDGLLTAWDVESGKLIHSRPANLVTEACDFTRWQDIRLGVQRREILGPEDR